MAAGSSQRTRWVCAQLGSREHYAIPRILHRRGALELLLTDYWAAGAAKLAAHAPGADAAKAGQRFHPELASAEVEHLGARRIVFEIWMRITRRRGWDAIMRRNELFQRVLIKRLRHREQALRETSPGIFFAYSYAAFDLLKWFRRLGWKTVLGQIDPGVHEEEIVAREIAAQPGFASRWTRAPARYWQLWREECALSDAIVVNSEWSREALVSSGIEAEKLTVIPLAFGQSGSDAGRSPPPPAFTRERPLRVLFLGQLTIRKGVHLALDAARRMRDEPVVWRFVGPEEVTQPDDLRGVSQVRWQGPVTREETAQLYRDADVFLLPTLSDGFALTQLESQARRLPVLASKFCGDVVRHDMNGLLLDPLSSDTIVHQLRRVLAEPALLARMSAASGVDERFSFSALEKNFEQLEKRLTNART